MKMSYEFVKRINWLLEFRITYQYPSLEVESKTLWLSQILANCLSISAFIRFISVIFKAKSHNFTINVCDEECTMQLKHIEG